MTHSDMAGLVAELAGIACGLNDWDGEGWTHARMYADRLATIIERLEARPSPPSRGGEVLTDDELLAILRFECAPSSFTTTGGAVRAMRRVTTHQPVPQVTVDEAMVDMARDAFKAELAVWTVVEGDAYVTAHDIKRDPLFTPNPSENFTAQRFSTVNDANLFANTQAWKAALTAALTQPATRKNDGSMMR